MIACVPENLATFAGELRARFAGPSSVTVDAPLASRTTLGVGGPADLLVEPVSEADLAVALRFCHQHGLPWRVLGRGSNVLVRDGGFRGMILLLDAAHFGRVERTGSQLRCGAAARLKAVAGSARKEGLAGLEFLEGIPGSVGGALRMNAGAHGSWMFEVTESVRFVEPSGAVLEAAAGDLQARYRSCDFLAGRVAVAAVLAGRPAAPEAIRERMEANARQRRASQPRAPSAGCIFKNPPSVPAGRLIEELGLKGTQIGCARVSEIHGNFIVNTGGATAADVLRLVEHVRTRAGGAGITLETEVEIIGEDSPPTRMRHA